MKEELEEAKNEFYSGNLDAESQDNSQDIRPSLADPPETSQGQETGSKANQSSDEHSVSEGEEDFNEEDWVKKWTLDNPEIRIPKEKQPDEDLDLDPEFDLESFTLD